MDTPTQTDPRTVVHKAFFDGTLACGAPATSPVALSLDSVTCPACLEALRVPSDADGEPLDPAEAERLFDRELAVHDAAKRLIVHDEATTYAQEARRPRVARPRNAARRVSWWHLPTRRRLRFGEYDPNTWNGQANLFRAITWGTLAAGGTLFALRQLAEAFLYLS